MIRYESMRVDKALFKDYTDGIKKALDSIQGQGDIEVLLEDFERTFAEYIGTRFAVALNSGTDALQLCLVALGVKSGDEVIVPNVTYPAVPLAVAYCGAKPIIVDIKEKGLNMDEDLIVPLITKKTRAIVAVHMFGRPVNLAKILDIAKKHKLYVVEDVCQAESSTYQGRRLGSFGDLSCFSFSYYKPLSSCGGGGGMVCFNEPAYQKIKDYTKVWLDDHALLKVNKRFARMYLLDLIAIQAKFKYLKSIIQSRLKAKDIYERELSKIARIKIFKDGKDSVSVPQNFVIFTPHKDRLDEYLRRNEIHVQSAYQPLHLMKAFKETKRRFPVSEKYYRQALYLPLFSFINEEEVYRIIELVKKFYG